MPISDKDHLNHEEVLKLLREIHDKPEMTQRELSSRLGISLGKVNFILQALISRGLVKVSNFTKSDNKKAYLYFLTPHGIEEKARTTYLFLQRKMEEYERLEMEIRQLKQELQLSDIPGSGEAK
ncbi:MAG: MarR family EPS-associated transcriptional regulator [Syntrophales bacterium]|jgi:EPS-associated MarR family transcriptional regulator